ncbi:lipoate--protein ligase family protein [Candidatus Micrarchaeota archaeon]|nr:lipoate--protein ligase family protein [Candidatus Micrarchaeota archaeon]
MKWRIIEYTENDAATNMAIDEAISEAVKKGQKPTIRFYGWKPSSVSIGYFQILEKEVDVKKCTQMEVGIVRRRTGGGAVYHDNEGEITYSIIANESEFPKDIIASYKVICGWIIDALKDLGIESEFKPINDIVVKGRKISGNAQTRRNGVLLQHGTILHKVDVEKMFSVLRVSDEKIKDKMIATVKERVTSVYQQKPISKDELYRALLKGFTNEKEIEFDGLTKDEINRTQELVRTKYQSNEWNKLR